MVNLLEAENLYNNYYNVKNDVKNDLENKKNPKTNKRYTNLEILEEVNNKWNNLSYIRKIRDRSPVSSEEGVQILKDYYLNKYPKNGLKKMVRDIKRRRKHVLEPNSKKSYLFRPLKDRNGNILKMPSGPETYDLEGVDAGTFPDSIINDDILNKLSNEIKNEVISKSQQNNENFNLILKSRRRNKSRKTKKSKNKSKKSKKGRKSKKPSNRGRKSRKVNEQKNENTALNTVRNIGNRINDLL